MDTQSGTLNINISDSAYSKSTNSNSQRSASSKSHPSESNSSKTSGYDGATNGANECLDTEEQALIKHNIDKEHKKKKSKYVVNGNVSSNGLVTECLKHTENFAFLDDVQMSNVEYNALNYFTNTLRLGGESINITSKSAPKQTTAACSSDELTFKAEDEKTKVFNAPVNGESSESARIKIQIDANTLASPVPIIDQLEPFSKVNASQVEDGFCCVISMSDGLVLFTTPNITNILGFPRDMWMGRSFTDFVHPKDKEAFCNQVTTGVTVPIIDATGKRRYIKSSLYVNLRKYKSLKRSGFGVVEKSVRYQAFHLTVTFKNATEYVNSKDLGNNGDIFLVIVAIPLYSAYKAPDEITSSKKFIMRHTSACTFSHVDADVVMNFGYFPQDMLGKSVFDFFHPDDMPFMKDVYKSVLTNCQLSGSVYKSKPYRFAARNGDFVIMETEWSSFLNPWSRRLEFITGLHQVLQGPKNPNVFDSLQEDETNKFPPNVLREAKIIQDEILALLKEKLVKPVESVRYEVSSRCKNLSTFMETIMSEVTQADLKVNSPANHNVSVSERESVMLGEISPHHDYYDRQSSSETPPSYNQLNYNENMQRFFKSKPLTTSSNGSVEKPIPLPAITDVDLFAKDLTTHQACNQKCLSPIQNSGDSGSGTGENLSSESSPNMDITSATNTSIDSYKRPHLTEALLIKHNVDMENIMRRRHRENRCSFKIDKESKKYCLKIEKKIEKENVDKRDDSSYQHGVKRSVSGSWDGENHKLSKYKHLINETEEEGRVRKDLRGPSDMSTDGTNNDNDNCYTDKTKNINLWPPFSVSMGTFGNSASQGVTTTVSPIGMFPIYCFQTQPGVTDFNVNGQTSHIQVQYVPTVTYNYNQVFPAASAVFCPQVTMLPYPSFSSPLQQQQQQQQQYYNHNQTSATVCVTTSNEVQPSPYVRDLTSEQHRGASQTASIKAEPGSMLGSVASPCNYNTAMSDISVCSPDFQLFNPPDDKGYLNCGNLPEKNADNAEQTSTFNMIRQVEESSYSSFYSSFLKTDTGSGSNDESVAVGSTNARKDKENYRKPKAYSIKMCDPPWMEAVSVTPDLVYRYQMTVKKLEDILESDLKVLESIEQPLMVNDQLDQLYLEMERDGVSTKLALEEGITSSSSSGEEATTKVSKKVKKKRKSFSSLTMIYEENAPFPDPSDYK